MSLLATLSKNFQTDLHEILSEGWQGAIEQMLSFDGDRSHRLDTGIVFRIRHYWEIWEVVNGHSFVLIRHMAALVSRALAEVGTVLVRLVCYL